ncbi:hypothetical protein ACIP93_00750 [Streptomyces sp. NPDC088745]|uniref:hypothetical protein n=1 Tax=Streptomyces sp. NPDC088745 TaxID=3365884 RepID=UPI003820283F
MSLAILVASAAMTGLVQVPAAAGVVANETTPLIAPADPDIARESAAAVPSAERAQKLGKDWQKSGDVAWTTTGDAQGFHLMTARESAGYQWQTTASLAEPGLDADQWIGNACVTGSGRYAVVVYAPRTFTNKPKLMARGGFTAVVDLSNGSVTKFSVTASLSYYNPGCGTGDTAVLTQSPGEDLGATRLIPLDAAKGTLGSAIVTGGQVTSAVRTGEGIVAAFGTQLVSIDSKGKKKILTRTANTAYRISPDGDGGVVFLDRAKRPTKDTEATTYVKRLPQVTKPAKPALLGHGKLSATGLTRAGKDVFVTGDVTPQGPQPRTVQHLVGASKDALVSSHAGAVVERTVWADGKGSPAHLAPQSALDARPVNIIATVRDTGEKAHFTVKPLATRSPQWEESRTPSPRLKGKQVAKDAGASKGLATSAEGGKSAQLGPRAAVDPRNEIVESERTCSVPRNDPRNQAMQPKPRQVEWAVDQAVIGGLNKHISRPANWRNLGMPAYSPQVSFPNPVLQGGGRVPAQILLGITTQESNMWQAARSAVPGVTASPLIGNYYGIDLYDGDTSNDWDINFDEADCGYGITQVTDHMRMAGREGDKGGAAWEYQKQRAVALDYTANIAAGLQILVEKWNQAKRAGVEVHDGDPKRIENWFFALWAYNSGFYENVNGNGPWGVGWANNPANPEWDAGRLPFMENRLGNEDASAAARPQHWPYPEKVLGFAAHPPSFLESPGKLVGAFRPAWWNGTGEDATVKGSAKQNRAQLKPPEDTFCGPYNECDPSKISDGASNSSPSTGPCQRTDSKCWWHQSVQWKTDCAYSCGNEFMRFDDTYPEEADGTAYPPNCSTGGLPANAMIIDDLPQGTPVIRPGCANGGWTNQGSFSIDFGNGDGVHPGTGGINRWPSKVDLHQLGAGFGGHFYFGHTRPNDEKGRRLKFTGTWTLNKAFNGAATVMVHLPDHGAHTKQARYRIDTGSRGVRTKVVSQPGDTNRWKNIGAFMFDGVPKVSLDTITPDGTGDQDIAFDAIAVVPINGTFVERTVQAVGFFDENQNLDTDPESSLLIDSPFENRQKIYDWGMKTSGDVIKLPSCASQPSPNCVMPNTGASMTRWNDSIRAAGTSPTDHPDGKSMASWLRYSNAYTDRPTSDSKPSRFDTDDSAYKIRNKATVSFVKDASGKIVEGSEFVEYDDRTADTHLPPFIMDFFKTVEQDYKINRPNLNYTTKDLNEHDGRTTTTTTSTTGILPGRAYAAMGIAPQLTENNTCVRSLYTSGGSIGYRPMLADEGATGSAERWKNALDSSPVVPDAVAQVAGEIYNAFFKPGKTGSLFNNAPPIWQELSFQLCADGKVKPYDGDPILRSSHMPSQYLYVDGKAINQEGNFTGSKAPVYEGSFIPFSAVLDLTGHGMGYGTCGPLTGHSANPWAMDVLTGAGANPPGKFCSWPSTTPDPQYSS